jgi:hypothetical protein
MNMGIEELTDWLKHQNGIPNKKARKETLLDIAGIEHLENHWSFIYLYFFNPKASHGLSRLFIDSLQEIICKRTKRPALSMNSFSVLREDTVPDEKGNMKRIDLLLQNDNEAIIIENKVYASLYNRLDLYWGNPSVPEENKRGVVLSLWRTHPTHKGFVNITHEELAKSIEKNLPTYFTSAAPKGLMLLQDFIQNIYNVTHSMNEEELYFYFNPENREKINRLAELRKSVITHIWTAIENSKMLEPMFKHHGWQLSVKTKNNVNYVYYTFNALPDKVMITLVYDTIWKSDRPHIRMFLELSSKEMISLAESSADYLKNLSIEPDGHKKESTWWHFKGYDIPFTAEELAKENVIAEKIISAIEESHFYDNGERIIELWKANQK